MHDLLSMTMHTKSYFEKCLKVVLFQNNENQTGPWEGTVEELLFKRSHCKI